MRKHVSSPICDIVTIFSIVAKVDHKTVFPKVIECLLDNVDCCLPTVCLMAARLFRDTGITFLVDESK